MENINFRIGHARDIHQLVSQRKLIIGGIEINFDKGALAHSDGDVLIHAIAEALLGALALGDLGTHFPATAEYKNIASTKILTKTYQMIKEAKYEIVNIDTSIYLEKPKLAPYIKEIRANIANILEINIDQISVKAGTNEKIDAVGKGEAIVSEAVCLLKGENK